MPQLDKVTLFSQVFWLLTLYFFFFIVFLKYYLPSFNKLFKFRLYYLTKNENIFSNKLKSINLVDFLNIFKNTLNLVSQNILFYYNSCVATYNIKLLNQANSMFIKAYNYNCLKFKLYRKLYL